MWTKDLNPSVNVSLLNMKENCQVLSSYSITENKPEVLVRTSINFPPFFFIFDRRASGSSVTELKHAR